MENYKNYDNLITNQGYNKYHCVGKMLLFILIVC